MNQFIEDNVTELCALLIALYIHQYHPMIQGHNFYQASRLVVVISLLSIIAQYYVKDLVSREQYRKTAQFLIATVSIYKLLCLWYPCDKDKPIGGGSVLKKANLQFQGKNYDNSLSIDNMDI